MTSAPGQFHSQGHLHPALAYLSSGINKNRNKRGYFFEAIFEYLRYYEQLYDEK